MKGFANLLPTFPVSLFINNPVCVEVPLVKIRSTLDSGSHSSMKGLVVKVPFRKGLADGVPAKRALVASA